MNESVIRFLVTILDTFENDKFAVPEAMFTRPILEVFRVALVNVNPESTLSVVQFII